MSYEDQWPFWLDDVCYEIGRGTRLLALPGSVTCATWGEIQATKEHLEQTHNVRIRGVPVYYENDTGWEVQVVSNRFVFDLLDLATAAGGAREHALTGVLLGYSGAAIESFLQSFLRGDV